MLHIYDNHLLASSCHFASGNLISLDYFFLEGKTVGEIQLRVKTPTLTV